MDYQVGQNFIDTRGTHVSRKGKRIFLRDYSTPSDVGKFVRYVRDIFKNPETKTLVIYIQDNFRVFPNQIVPLACVIEYIRGIGKKVLVHNDIKNVADTHFDNPIPAERARLNATKYLDGIVWKITSAEQCYALVDSVIFALSYKADFGRGTLQALDWTLNEVIDNVLLHSKSGAAYFMYQPQLIAGQLAFSVGDYGQGFQSSFIGSRYAPSTEADAITLAVKKDVTRDPAVGAGNGLWGTLRIIGQNGGRLTIASGGSAIFFRTDEGVARCYEGIGTVDEICKTSLVDIQLLASNPTDLTVAFERESTPVCLFFENFEDDEGASHFSFREWWLGTGTRESGADARTLIANIMANNPGPIILDFGGLGIISSSFADEALGRLSAQLGKEEFNSRVRITGLNNVTRMILASVLERRGLKC